MEYIFVHGLGQPVEAWDSVIELLAPKKITCARLAQLIVKGECNYEGLYTAFEAYCNSFNEPIHLVGQCVGGVLALDYAVKNPKNVLSVAVIGIQYKTPQPLQAFKMLCYHLKSQKYYEDLNFAQKDFIDIMSTMKEVDLSVNFNKLACKCLVVCGKGDAKNKPAAKALASCLKKGTLAIVENSGHYVNSDNPRALFHELNYFYQNL